MTVNGNYEIQSILGTLQSVSTSAGANNDWTNSIFGTGFAATNIAFGGHNEKVSGTQSIANIILKLVTKLAGNESSTASSEVSSQSDKADKSLTEAEKQEQKLNNQIESCGEDVEEQRKILESCVKDLSDKQTELEKEKEEVNAIIEAINNKQAELAKETDPEKQKELLSGQDGIQGLSAQLTDHIKNVSSIEKDITELSVKVAKSYKKIEATKTVMRETLEKGQEEIQTQINNANENSKALVNTGADGAQNIITGEGAKEAGDFASSNTFTAAAAPKLYQVAADQKSAGNTRLKGVAKNVKKIQEGIGKISSNTELLATFQNTIGNAIGNYNELLGSWDSTIDPVIESIGSWSTVSESKKNLDDAVKTDLKTVKKSNKKPAQEEQKADGTVDNNFVTTSDGQKIENISGLNTPVVEFKILGAK